MSLISLSFFAQFIDAVNKAKRLTTMIIIIFNGKAAHDGLQRQNKDGPEVKVTQCE